MEPVNVLGKIPSSWDQSISSTKWKDRLAALDELIKLFETEEKFAAGSCDVLVGQLKKLVNDVILPVATAAATALGLLARGLEGPGFQPHVQSVSVALMEKFKEKKLNVVKELHTALGYVIQSSNVVDFIDDATDVVNPKKCRLGHVKKEVLELLLNTLPVGKCPKSWSKQSIIKSAKSISSLCILLADDTTEDVRDRAIHLLAILATYTGEKALAPQVEKLGAVKAKKYSDFVAPAVEEAEAATLEIDKAKMERTLVAAAASSDASEGSSLSSGGGGGGGGFGVDAAVESSSELDPWDMAEPQDIFVKLPPNFNSNLASAKIWKEKKAMCDELSGVCKEYPRLSPTNNFDALLSILRKLIPDVNIVVGTAAINCVKLIADGLRTDFAPYVHSFIIPLLEKFKEKKPPTILAIHAVLKTFPIAKPDSVSEIVEAVSAINGRTKLSQVKKEGISSLSSILRLPSLPKSSTPPQVLRSIAQVALVGMDDSVNEVRNAAVDLFVALAECGAEKTIKPFLGKLDSLKSKKVSEAIGKISSKQLQTSTSSTSPTTNSHQLSTPTRNRTLHPIPSPLSSSLTPRSRAALKLKQLAASDSKNLSSSKNSKEEPQDLESALSVLLQSSNSTQLISALKLINTSIERDEMEVATISSEVVNAIMSVTNRVFADSLFDMRLAKHCTNTLNLLFCSRAIARALRLDSLKSCIDSLLRRLLDPSLPMHDPEGTLLRALNAVVLKILENSATTLSFTALLELLKRGLLSEKDNPPSPSANPSLCDITSKCILKLTKPLPSRISDVNVVDLLPRIESFLSTAPPASSIWLRGNAAPLRTTKTLINELVKVVGPEIKKDLQSANLPPDAAVHEFVEILVERHFPENKNA